MGFALGAWPDMRLIKLIGPVAATIKKIDSIKTIRFAITQYSPLDKTTNRFFREFSTFQD